MGCVVCEQTDGQAFYDGKEKPYEVGIVKRCGDGQGETIDDRPPDDSDEKPPFRGGAFVIGQNVFKDEDDQDGQ